MTRLPRNLRRRVAAETPVPHVPYWNQTLQADYCAGCGDLWPCLPWRQAQPPACRCSHPESAHGTDRKNRRICYGSAVCGCIEFREKATA